jgi:predicted DNA-binding transcriptional regulator YafY
MQAIGNELAVHYYRQKNQGGDMKSLKQRGLELTEDEAFALLGMVLTSPGPVDETSAKAMRKLAEYCSQRSEESNHKTNHSQAVTWQPV